MYAKNENYFWRLYGTSERVRLAIESRWVVRNNSKQQVLVGTKSGDSRRDATERDETGQGLEGLPQIESDGKYLRQANKSRNEAGRQGGRREHGVKKGQKQKKEGMFYVGRKEIREPHRKLRYDKSRTQERPKRTPK